MLTKEFAAAVFGELSSLIVKDRALGVGIDENNEILLIYTSKKKSCIKIKTYIKEKYPEIKIIIKYIGKTSTVAV